MVRVKLLVLALTVIPVLFSTTTVPDGKFGPWRTQTRSPADIQSFFIRYRTDHSVFNRYNVATTSASTKIHQAAFGDYTGRTILMKSLCNPLYVASSILYVVNILIAITLVIVSILVSVFHVLSKFVEHLNPYVAPVHNMRYEIACDVKCNTFLNEPPDSHPPGESPCSIWYVGQTLLLLGIVVTDYMMLNFIDPELNWNMLMVPIAVILVVEYILMRAIVYTSKPEITRLGCKGVCITMPNGEMIYYHRNDFSVGAMKHHLCANTGISVEKMKLYHRNKQLKETEVIQDQENISVHLPLYGGAKECDICFGLGEYTCEDCCNKMYCGDCCKLVHKHPLRNKHTPQPITVNDDTNGSGSSSELEDTSDTEFPFSDSPDTSSLFEQATMTMTLADRFDITRFKSYQKEVITQLLNGRDCLVIQPTGSGKSLCFQFPPVYQNKKAIVITPTISLMKDQVINSLEKGIKAAYLGSAQPDVNIEDVVLSPDSPESLIFVTPEWISKPQKMDKIQNLVRQEKISLIALDEAHLLHLWPQFRKAYQELEHLKINFPTMPIIALTATAPPEVETTIVKILRNPFISRESINRPNIYLACEEMPGRKDFSYFASRVAELIGDSTTIIYTDFIDDIGPIVSELNECSIDCVAYHGEMDIKSRNDSYTKWRNGDIKVMVATSAFGMGIDKANIRNIIRYGVPENMCSWAQDFGRAGRDGQPSKAYIFYHTSNVEHASAWIKGNLQNHQHCQRILREFSSSWKYVTSHLVHRCRREMLLELFEEDPAIIADADKTCCDVCELEQIGTEDRFEELKMLHDAIEVLGQKGEVKLAQWLRGTSLAWGNKFNKQAYSYGCSAMHSEKWWRTFMRQCHVLRLVNKELKSIIKQSQHYGIQGVYFTTQHGKQLIQTGDKLEIKTNMFNLSNDKIVSQKGKATNGPSAANSTAEKKVRKGKGTHGLNVIRALIEDKENWEEITTKHAYQFPGVFESPKMQRVYYTPNCTELEQSCSTNHHFLWDDNQLSKGSWKDREVKVNIDNEQTALIYRSAPCNGVKVCPAKDCNYVTSVSSLRSCRNHSKEKLVKTNIKCPCPVDFAYLYPKDCATDHRRWVLGFIHHQKQPVDNLHNHEIHNASKMCSMVKETIRDVAVLNPTIKPSELAKGKGVPYIPGAVDRGSSHLGRISRELQPAKHSTVGGKSWSVNNFEAVADEIDTNDSKKSGEANNELKHLCRPYLCSAGIEDGINYIFTMNPLMSQLLASSNFIEADITFNETKEYPYLFNVAAFNDTTMQWMVVSRVRLDRQGQVAHKLAFQKTFDKCKQDHPHFEPGKTLQGIVVDWSDAEIQGLGAAVGPETARYLLKGCSVHWMRSWQKIRDRVATSKDKQREKALFSQIASQIQKLAGQHISLCFEVLSGIKSAKLLLGIVTNLHEQDVQFIDEECAWSTAKHWAQWWTRPKHLAMLHKDFSKMDDIVWQKCPRDTNAVERKNRDSKERTVSPLQSSIINLYKLDKSECAKHLAASECASMTYNDRSAEAKKSAAESRKRQRYHKYSDDVNAQHGPPDKKCHFESKRKRPASQSSHPSTSKRMRTEITITDDSDSDFENQTAHTNSSKYISIAESEDESIQILNDVSTDGSFSYKPPDVSYMGRRLKMKFKIAETGKEEWFEGQITTYNGLNGKYGVFFPVDKQVVFIYPTDKDIIFLST